MDEVVLKKMNKEEKTILEEELKKVCTEKKRGITAACWGVEKFEKIRDLLDNGAELEKLEAFLKEKKLGADTYYHNGMKKKPTAPGKCFCTRRHAGSMLLISSRRF